MNRKNLIPIYLDYNGSTPLDSRVLEHMLPVLAQGVGNPSSSHLHGRLQSSVIQNARDQVANLVGGRSSNVIFTASATEANNLALLGVLNNSANRRGKILISAVEHSSVFNTAQWIAKKGLATIKLIPVTPGGFIDLNSLEDLVDSDTALVSVMAANSETGVLNPVSEISKIAQSHNVLFHCDATQMVGRIPLDMENTGCDLVSVSSHKIYGPGGVGSLIGSHKCIRSLEPIIHGGGHEQGLRSGSLNTAGIAGFGKAAEICTNERLFELSKVRNLRDYFVSELKTKICNIRENGDIELRLPNTANIRFENAAADAVLANLDLISASMGSACSSGAIEPSRVLLAMGVSREAASESIRFSLGRFTTLEEINQAIAQIVISVEYVRNLTLREVV